LSCFVLDPSGSREIILCLHSPIYPITCLPYILIRKEVELEFSYHHACIVNSNGKEEVVGKRGRRRFLEVEGEKEGAESMREQTSHERDILDLKNVPRNQGDYA
jgi:hypothetical protein